MSEGTGVVTPVKLAAASVVKFLKQQLDSTELSADARESVEVAAQCVETAFELGPGELRAGRDLLALLAPAADTRAAAEKAKNDGNELMKAERHREALERYNQAVQLDPTNAVYFCNRAAAHFKLNEHEAAVADCTAALGLQPDYSKAHGRLGLAFTALDRHREARAAFARASQLDPTNESYRQNLRLADERLATTNNERPLELAGLLQNPALLNMASEMLADPNLQNLISGLMTSTGQGAAPGAGVGGAGGVGALLEAGQALAQNLQAANPELVEQLRRRLQSQQPPPAP